MNRNKTLGRAAALAIACLFVSAPAGAWMNKEEKAWVEQLENRVADLERRMQRAERLLDSSNLQKMYLELERSQNFSRSLQGQIEELQYKVQQMEKSQREIFLDYDQRLQQLQSGGGAISAQTIDGGTGSEGELSGTADFDEAAQYKSAFDYLKARNFPEAIKGFESFLQQWPRSSLAGNAQYWLGEAYYGNRDYKSAAREFDKVRTLYPESSKVPDALLKLGYSYYSLKRWKDARKVLEEVKAQYGGTTAADLAAERLKRMKLEGH